MISTSDQVSSKRILVGIILGAHGIKGDVRLKSFTDDPQHIVAYGPLETDTPQQMITIQSLKPKAHDVFLARLQGINNRTTAEQLKGVKLYIKRTQLKEPEPDEFYATDLLRLSVRDSHGTDIGMVLALHNFGAGDLIEIQRRDNTAILIPFTQEACPEINIDNGYIIVNEAILQAFEGSSTRQQKDK